MTVLLIVVVGMGAWLLVALAVALLLGRTISLADRNQARTMATRAVPAPVAVRPLPVLVSARRG